METINEEEDDKPRICECCGQKIRKLNPHRMDKQKVATLEILAKARIEGNEWVKMLAGDKCIVGGITKHAPYRAGEHAMRLTWFGLAEHGDRRSGLYRITPLGLQFLTGDALVHGLIYCRNGKVVETTPDLVRVSDVRGVVLDEEYWSNYAAIQKHASDDHQPPTQDTFRLE